MKESEKGYCENCGWYCISVDQVPAPFAPGSVSMETGECQLDDPDAPEDCPRSVGKEDEGIDYPCWGWKPEAE